jgi:hypothetical protein
VVVSKDAGTDVSDIVAFAVDRRLEKPGKNSNTKHQIREKFQITFFNDKNRGNETTMIFNRHTGIEPENFICGW